MSDELKTIKFQLMLSPREAQSIDDWGFKNRIRTRAEAIRRLCQIGLAFDGHSDALNEQTQLLALDMAKLTELATKEDVEVTLENFIERLQNHDAATAELLLTLFHLMAVLRALKSGKHATDAIEAADAASTKEQDFLNRWKAKTAAGQMSEREDK